MDDEIKLRIWATTKWSYKYSLKNIPLIMKAGWLPMIVFGGCLLIILYDHAMGNPNKDFTLKILMVWAASYFAVPWHKAILLNNRNPKAIRIHRAEIIYFLVLLFIESLNQGISLIQQFFDDPSQAESFGVLAHLAFIILVLSLTALLPAIAINDRSMTRRRVWKLWEGNRTRFFLLSGLNYFLSGTGVYIALKSYFALSRWLTNALQVNHENISFFGQDFAQYMLAHFIPLPITVVVVFFFLSGSVGTLSISYSSIARKGLEIDPEYQPDKEFRDQLAL